MENKKKHSVLDLSASELNNIDEYRKKRNTAVLTIMFTDIQGFTALTENKGETYVHELHREHDKILVNIIEEDHAGIVIKYIGDSIMAVFSEPTAAAEKALKIQKELDAFNKAHPELDDIIVRIGLHMGQTVIENKIQTDLFGRHVNKASRVESLAAGGHIYISYPVFDSVKSWLMDTKTAASKFHGSYYLKGISKAEDIYEIYNVEITKPQAPKKARKEKALFPALPIALAIAILGIAGLIVFYNSFSPQNNAGQTGTEPGTETQSADAVVISQSAEPDDINEKNKQEGQAVPAAKTPKDTAPALSAANQAVTVPEVFFLGMIAREPILDFDIPLAVTVENEAQGLKKSINDIGPGKHIVHYDVSYMVRYYSEFLVTEGKNIIRINFKESYLPNIDAHLTVAGIGEKTEPAVKNAEAAYFVYDRKTLARLDFTGKLSLELNGTKKQDGTNAFTAHYTATLNGEKIADETAVIEYPESQKDRIYEDEIIFHEDKSHYYFYKYSYSGDTLQFSIGASFKE